MNAPPSWVVDELLAAATRRRRPAWLRIARGRIVEAGGDLPAYGLDASAVGASGDEVLPVLGGLDAVDETVRFDWVELSSGLSVDISVVPRGEELLILLLDRSAEVAERRIAQQLSNEVGLLRDELARHAAAPAATPAGLEPSRVAIVAIVFRGLGDLVVAADRAEAAAEAVAEASRVVGLLVRTAARPLLDEGGRVGSLDGDMLTAVFGLLPTTVEVERLGVAAALRALGSVEELSGSASAAIPVRAAVGVAAGPALVGSLATRSLSIEATISDAVGTARRLARRAPIGTVVLERATIAPCRDLATSFESLDGPDDLLVHRSPQPFKKEVVS